MELATSDYRDFLRAQSAGSVDLLLTDPPYAISRATGFSQVKRGERRFSVNMDFGDWDKEEIDLNILAQESYRVLKRGGTAIVWYDLWKISHVETALREAGFKMLRLIIWQKTNPVPLNQRATYLSNSREVAVVGVKGGKPTFHGIYHNGIYNHPIPRHSGKKIHPTQKPLALFAELIRTHSNEGDLVIDPFLGSGTSACAAAQEGRRFAGCDIDADYMRAVRARVQSL